MSKKTTITLAVVGLIIVVFVVFYFFINKNHASNTGQQQIPSFGNNLNPINPISVSTQNNNPSSETQSTSTTVIPKLRQISNVPTAGAIAFNISSTTNSTKKTSTETIIRYVESATGHIKQTQADSLNNVELSLTTIPKLYESVWVYDGSASYMRYLNDNNDAIESYYGKVTLLPTQKNASTSGSIANQTQIIYAPYQTQGNFLPENISEMVPSKDSSSLFYIQENNTGSQIISSNLDGTHTKTLLNSPLKEWVMSWVNDNTLALTTKASALSDGYLYFLNTSTGEFDNIMNNKLGLTALSDPAGKNIMFVESNNNGGIDGGLYNIQNGSISPFPAATLPEKCVWSNKKASMIYCAVPTSIPIGDYPDVWYQGRVSFNDDFWEINTSTGTSTLVANPQGMANVQIDGIHLFLDKMENFLFFTNKKDGTLWSIDLN